MRTTLCAGLILGLVCSSASAAGLVCAGADGKRGLPLLDTTATLQQFHLCCAAMLRTVAPLCSSVTEHCLLCSCLHSLCKR